MTVEQFEKNIKKFPQNALCHFCLRCGKECTPHEMDDERTIVKFSSHPRCKQCGLCLYQRFVNRDSTPLIIYTHSKDHYMKCRKVVVLYDGAYKYREAIDAQSSIPKIEGIFRKELSSGKSGGDSFSDPILDTDRLSVS